MVNGLKYLLPQPKNLLIAHEFMVYITIHKSGYIA